VQAEEVLAVKVEAAIFRPVLGKNAKKLSQEKPTSHEKRKKMQLAFCYFLRFTFCKPLPKILQSVVSKAILGLASLL
jgi:hypothetical protein